MENMEKKQLFLFDVFGLGWITALWYERLAFQNLLSIESKTSGIIFWSFILLSDIIGVLLFIKTNRNGLTEFSLIVLPLEIYSIFSYLKLLPHTVIPIAAVSAAAAITAACRVLCRRIPAYLDKKRVIRHRIIGAAARSSAVLALGLALLAIPIGLNQAFDYKLLEPRERVPWEDAEKTDLPFPRASMDELEKLDTGKWAALDVKQRADVMQTVADVEAMNQGLPFYVKIEVGDIQQKSTATELAYYDDSTRTILVDSKNLSEMTAYGALLVTLHEIYHANQACLVRAYQDLDEAGKHLKEFSKIEEWENDEYNYKSGDEDYQAYAEQELEKSASNYAKDRAASYLIYVAYYIINKGC